MLRSKVDGLGNGSTDNGNASVDVDARLSNSCDNINQPCIPESMIIAIIGQ